MSVDSSGLLVNQGGPHNNPWELDYFEYQTEYTDPDDFCSHVKWSISGDVPEGISIDSDSGLISGDIKAFYDQPSADDNHPKEELKFDGSNWEKNGRFKHDHYDFHFTITRDTLVAAQSGGACDKVKPLSESNDVIIKEVKCNNIDNKLYAKNYLESKEETPEGSSFKLNVDGVEYTDYKEFQKAHPGPWKCP